MALWLVAHFALLPETASKAAAVQQNGFSLHYASKETVQQNGFSLQCLQSASKEMVQQNGFSLQYASKETVQQNGFSFQRLQYASKEMVQQDGFSLQYASKEMKSNKNVVIVAVQQNGRGLALSRIMKEHSRPEHCLNGRMYAYIKTPVLVRPNHIYSISLARSLAIAFTVGIAAGVLTHCLQLPWKRELQPHVNDAEQQFMAEPVLLDGTIHNIADS